MTLRMFIIGLRSLSFKSPYSVAFSLLTRDNTRPHHDHFNTTLHYNVLIHFVFVCLYKSINIVSARLSGVVFTLWLSSQAVRGISAMPLFYWVATFGKLFTHIASPVFTAPRNWDIKGTIRT